MAEYPLPVFSFQVDWGGQTGAFSEVSGLGKEVEMLEYRDGVSKQYSSIKMPGRPKDNAVTLKRGVFEGNNEFYEWYNTITLNKVERRDITVSLLNEAHEPVMVWKIKNAWCMKVTSPDLKADGNEVAIETIELAHEGITIENS